MKTNSFILTEQDDTIIGVVMVVNNEDLNNKVQQALEEHFDCSCVSIIDLDMEHFLYGRVSEFGVMLDDNNSTDEDLDRQIFIQSVAVFQ